MSNNQKIAFRKNFKYEFDGSTSYSYKNSFITNTKEFSLYLFTTPTTDSTRNVMFSCGNKISNSILFEVGVSTGNKLFIYDGSTETEIGNILTSGNSYYITVVYLNNLLIVYINDNVYATGLDLGATEGITLVIGESITSGDYYEGGLTDVFLFAEGHDRKSVQAVTGYGNVIDWSPKFLLSSFGGDYTDGLYFDGNEDDSYTLNTQPNNTNSNFVLWTGVNPDATPTAWYKKPVIGVIANHIESNGDACRLVSDGTDTNITRGVSSALIGNRYEMNLNLLALAFGGLRVVNNEVVEILASGQIIQEFTASAASSLGLKRFGAVDATFTDLVFHNLSCTHLNPYTSGTLYGSNFEQTTAVDMPWKDSSGNGVSFDGVTDRIQMTASIGGKVHVCMLMQIDSFSLYGRVLDTIVSGELTLLQWTGQTLRARSGGVVSGATTISTFTLGVPFVVDIVYGGDSIGVKLAINGGTFQTGLGDPVSATALVLGSTSAGIGSSNQCIQKMLVVEGELSANDRAQVVNYLLRLI